MPLNPLNLPTPLFFKDLPVPLERVEVAADVDELQSDSKRANATSNRRVAYSVRKPRAKVGSSLNASHLLRRGSVDGVEDGGRAPLPGRVNDYAVEVLLQPSSVDHALGAQADVRRFLPELLGQGLTD